MKTNWIKLAQIAPGANPNIYLGCTDFKAERDYLYPERRLKLNSTIIWIPAKKIHVGIASYVDAQKNGDEAALAKLTELGIPLGVKFSADNDFSGTYDVVKEDAPRRGRKPGSGPVAKVMRAEFAAEYEDGRKFKKGDVVKILFRAKYAGESGGAKAFRNVYERPTEEELKEFLEKENA